MDGEEEEKHKIDELTDAVSNVQIIKRKRKRQKERPKGSFAFLTEIFDEVQRTVVCHRDNADEIFSRFEHSVEDLHQAWKPLLQLFCVRFKDDKPTTKTEKFIIFLCTHFNFEDPENYWSDDLAEKLMSWCLKFINSKDRAVRYRVCRLIGFILNEMNEDAGIDENLWSMIEAKLQDRLHDRIREIRNAASLALNRLQDSQNSRNCPITQQFVETMSHDKDQKCRLICLQQIHLNRHTLNEIVYRARDVDWRVRKEVYTRLRGVEMKIFTIRQRVCLLHAGLTDRDNRVKENCLRLVRDTWLDRLEFNIIEFLQLLHVEEYQEDLESVMMTILEHEMENLRFPSLDGPPPYHDNDILTSEMTFFWRLLVEFHKKYNNIDQYEMYIGGVSIEDFCHLLGKHKKYAFIAQNLLKLSMHLDFADQYGRNVMIHHCRDLLKDEDFGVELVPDLMSILRKLFKTEETNFVNCVIEDLQEIRDPLMEEVEELSEELEAKYEAKLKKLSGQIETLDQEIQELGEERKFEEARQKQDALTKKEEEHEKVYKKLNKKLLLQESIYSRQFTIVTNLLQHTRVSPDHPLIESIEKELIMPAWQSEVWTANAEIRCQGVQALGTYCMLTKQFALLHLWLFFNLSSEDPEVQYVMVQVMLDLLLRYNFTDDELLNAYNPFADEIDENDQKIQGKLNITNAKLIEHIFDIFKETDDLLTKKVVVEGICKLLMTNKLEHKQEEILIEFMLLFQTPYAPKEQAAIEIMDTINQILAMFFPCYYRRSVNVSEGSRQTLLRVLVRCIMEITTKHSKHILRTIKRTQMCKYMLWLLEESCGAAADSGDCPKALHQRLAHILLQNLNQPKVNTEAMRTCCHVLTNLDLSGNFPNQLIAIHELQTQLKIEDRACQRDLAKFAKVITDALAALKKESEEEEPSVVEPDFFREEDAEFAENIQDLYSKIPLEKARRRSLPLMQSPGQTPTQMRGKKRKLTNLQKLNFDDEEAEEDSEEVTEVSEPPPKRKRKSNPPKKKKKLSPKKSKSPSGSSAKKQRLSPASSKKKKRQSSPAVNSKKKKRQSSPAMSSKKKRRSSLSDSKKKRRSSLSDSKKKRRSSLSDSKKKKSSSKQKASARKSSKKSSSKKKKMSAKRSSKKSASKRKRLSPRKASKKRKNLDYTSASTDATESEKQTPILNLEESLIDEDFASLVGDSGYGSSGIDDEIEALLNE